MLRLKELELLGFKSFADRTRLAVDGSTAGVVGPNGCGKSNLADAVSWVLGEQSARILRGERMSDVIFNGTGERPPTGLAEVSMTLVESEDEAAADELEKVIGLGAAEPSSDAEPAQGAASSRPARRRGEEVKVTRRLFRSGESEYLLNGDPCRLRDIHDLFMGTGLGPESYAIIEQGRIGQILSSKPSDRRAIIEEAAGIAKFKSRKRLAEAKLESSRQNLARINDILEEIIKQVNSLKRQASKAARYKELHNQLRERQRVVFASRLIALEAECGRLRTELDAAAAACESASAALEELEGGRAAAAARYEQAEERAKLAREALAANEIESERLHSRIDRCRQQLEAIEARVQEAGEERVRLEEQADALSRDFSEHERRAAEARGEWSGAKAAAAELAQRRANLAAELAAAEANAEAKREAMLLSISRAAEIRNEAVKMEEVCASSGREIARVEADLASAGAENARLAEETDRLRAARAESDAAAGETLRRTEAARSALESARKNEAESAKEAADLGREHSQTSARRQALEETLARHAYSADSVRRLLSAGSESFRPLGVLADFLEVEPGYEEAVEDFLRRELDCIVVERPEEAKNGIALLGNSGRSTFFVRQLPSGAAGSGSEGVQAEVKSRPGVRAALRDVARFSARLGLGDAAVLPALANCFMAEDSEAAARLAAEFPTCHFLTPQGEHYYHRCISGGKTASAGPLALRRDFRALERRAAELQSSLREAESRWTEMKSRCAALEEDLERLSAEQSAAEKQAMLAAEKLRQATDAGLRAEERASVHGRELTRLTAERANSEQRRAELRDVLDHAELERAGKEQEIAAAVESSRGLRQSLDETDALLTQAQIKASALEERMSAAESGRERAGQEVAAVRERIGRMLHQADAAGEERRRLTAEAAAAEASKESLAARQEELRDQLDRETAESQSARTERDGLAPRVDAARAGLDDLKQSRSNIEIAQARAGSDLSHHVLLAADELGLQPDALRASVAEPLEGEPLRFAEEEMRELKGKIERLGPVNMTALEELEESEERMSFLDAQRQDLLASINDTSETISEIDGASQRKFNAAFKAINLYFAESFRSLFGGGAAEMLFTDEADPESGIDLAAQPQGKRLQNVLLLSGGEKALTALALLIAVFRFAPSPFCILDEVDAPLDESNAVRLARMIESMSGQTQFILITHNKRTMEICRMLYGVTMEEAGVSKLVSVKFAAREREAVAATA